MSANNNVENLEGLGEELEPRKQIDKNKLRMILALVSIIGTYIAAVVLGNTKVLLTTGNGNAAVDDAISNYLLNDASSKTVYNQMVTNGWVAKDLLKNISTQNSAIIDNQIAMAQLAQGTNALLTYGLGMVAVIGIAIVVTLYAKKN